MLPWKTATTMKILLCFKLTITMVIASSEEESKPQMSDGDIHHIACVQRWRLEETCKVGQWLECPPDSNMDRIRVSPSTTDTSEDLSPSMTVSAATVTTQDSEPHVAPSPADRRLFYASRNGDLERVKLILAAGHVNINTRKGYSKRTPVMVATENGHRDVVEFLVGRGADVSLVDRYGNNALHLACFAGNLETVKLILSLNVLDINARNNEGETATDRASVYRRQRVLDVLVSHGAQ